MRTLDAAAEASGAEPFSAAVDEATLMEAAVDEQLQRNGESPHAFLPPLASVQQVQLFSEAQSLTAETKQRFAAGYKYHVTQIEGRITEEVQEQTTRTPTETSPADTEEESPSGEDAENITLFKRFGPPIFKLHGYQINFLYYLAKTMELETPGAALEMIVDRAMKEHEVRKAIFDGFHCMHCSSAKPASWIAKNKGSKYECALHIRADAVDFLSGKLLVQVAKRGNPPTRQVVEGPLRSDMHKAARCCVDWAIKQYDAEFDGQPKGAPQVSVLIDEDHDQDQDIHGRKMNNRRLRRSSPACGDCDEFQLGDFVTDHDLCSSLELAMLKASNLMKSKAGKKKAVSSLC